MEFSRGIAVRVRLCAPNRTAQCRCARRPFQQGGNGGTEVTGGRVALAQVRLRTDSAVSEPCAAGV
eukprot:4429080-Pyramimonas_sp.AAC.1